jgi:hypothetical protein
MEELSIRFAGEWVGTFWFAFKRITSVDSHHRTLVHSCYIWLLLASELKSSPLRQFSYALSMDDTPAMNVDFVKASD